MAIKQEQSQDDYCKIMDVQIVGANKNFAFCFHLRWQRSLSVEVDKNINLGYSKDQGYAYFQG